MRSFIAFLLDHKYVASLVLLATFITAGFTATYLQIEPAFSALISDDSTYNTNDRILEQTFHENSGLILLYDVKDKTILDSLPSTLNTSSFRNHAEEMRDALSQSQYVTATRPAVVSEDGKTAYLSVSLFVPNEVNSFKPVKEEIQGLTDAVPPPNGVDVTVSGFPTILDRTATLLITDNLTTMFITIVLVFLVLYWYFKDLVLALVGMTAPLLSVISLAAVMVLLGINVTLTLAAVGVLIIGLGADYSVHLTVAFQRLLRDGESVREAVLDAVDELTVPITASFLTTLAGFVALIFGAGPSSTAQGIVLSIGIALIYLITFLCLPVLLTTVATDVNTSPNTLFTAAQDKLANIAAYQGEHPYAVILVVILLTAGFAYGATYVYFSTSNSNWIPEDDPVSLSFNQFEYTFGRTDSLTLLVRTDDDDLRTPETVRTLKELAAQLRGLPSVDRVDHPFQGVKPVPGAIQRHVEQPRIKQLFNEDYTFTTVRLSSDHFEINENGDAVILDRVRGILDTFAADHLSFSLYGDAVRFEELGESLQGDTVTTTLIGLGLVAVISSVIYTSVVVGFTALLPIILALVWAVGLMGITGVPFTSLSTGLLSLVLGIGVDFSIHLVDSIKRYVKTNPINTAIKKTLTTSGSAIVLSSVTTLFGFLALSVSNLLGTRRFGWSLALSILAVFTVTILLVPAIMSLQHQNPKET